ncbi:MAG: GNAT family N-acetyltransferase [Saccharospirillum sp.]
MQTEHKRYMYETGRLGLKRLDEEALSGNYPYWFRDPEVNRYNRHFGKPESFAQVRAYVEQLDSDETRLVFAVYWLENGLHLGNIGVQSIDWRQGSAELAFLFGEKAYWNKGVAHEATKVVIDHCRQQLNLRRLHLGCLAENTAMCKLAEKCQFEQEGRLREAVFANGHYQDVVLYGRLL